MTTATLSPKFQVVIPKEVREQMDLDPGMQFAVIPFEGRIVFIPLRPIEELEGKYKGMNTDNIREKKDRPL
ncbi:MAG: AbrB/MazE/SpoVT family DNA-binding domain-containing protein [Candidatus Peregrinibacteria bacterium]